MKPTFPQVLALRIFLAALPMLPLRADIVTDTQVSQANNLSSVETGVKLSVPPRLARNVDDDQGLNETGFDQWDMRDMPSKNENDLGAVILTGKARPGGGTMKLKILEGKERINDTFWLDANKTTKATVFEWAIPEAPSASIDPSDADLSRSVVLYIEGYQNSEEPNDIKLQAEVSNKIGSSPDPAKAEATVYELDLDVDSNNNGTIEDEDEDRIEASKDPEKPGKVLVAGLWKDSDGDNVPDFADGLGLPVAVGEGTSGKCGDSEAKLVEIKVEIKSPVKPEEAEVVFDYGDFASIPRVGGDGDILILGEGTENSPRTYHLKKTGLRIWAVDAEKREGSANVGKDVTEAGGKFIPPGKTLKWTEIVKAAGAASGSRSLTLYLEYAISAPEPGQTQEEASGKRAISCTEINAEQSDGLATDKINIALLPLKLKKCWETANQANQIFNKTLKDDSTGNLAVIEKEENAVYCLPRNNLYVVGDSSNKLQVSVDLEIPLSYRDKFICAAYHGSAKIAGTDMRVPSNRELPVEMEIETPAEAVVREFDILAGYDANGNDLLDLGEAHRLFVYRKTDMNGSPVNLATYATVKGISRAKYQENYQKIQDYVEGTLFSVGVKNGLPHAHTVLTRFLYGDFRGVPADLIPNDSLGTESFDCFKNGKPGDSCFSEWLTHNSGAWFDKDGKVLMSKSTWGGDSSFSNFLESVTPFALKTPILTYSGNIDSPVEFKEIPTETGKALKEYYERNIKAVADADLALKADWEWYFSPWVAFPNADGPHLKSLSANAWPTSTVLMGELGGETGVSPHVQMVAEWLGGDPFRLQNHDALLAVGRARANCEYQFQVRREPRLFGGYKNVVKAVRCRGRVKDLYDFNFEDGNPPEDSLAQQAATIQLGGGAGRGSSTMPASGHIFLEEWNIDAAYEDPFE